MHNHSLSTHLFGFVDDVTGPNPVALEVSIETGIEASGPQSIPRNHAFIHDHTAPPERQEPSRREAELVTGRRAVAWVGTIIHLLGKTTDK